jgi:methionyl-tRNA formyltransferase
MEIIFSGGSHYGECALKSLQKIFDKVYILSNNSPEIISLKRENDILIDNFLDCSCKYVFLGGHPDFITDHQLQTKTYINVHGALLPKYRGMHSTFWAIMNDEKQLGITFHLVDKYMDSGDILAQYSIDYYGQTVQEINNEIDRLVELNTGEVLLNYLNGDIKPIKQNINEATFGCRRNLSDCIIDFNMDIALMKRFFKALTVPYPLPRLSIKEQMYEVVDSEIIDRDFYSMIGRVLNIDDKGIWIKIKGGFLVVSLLRSIETKELADPRNIIKTGYRFI